MAREINLVPDIKGEMIKALKLRNFIFFLCMVVAAASVGAVFVLGTIVGGQDIALNGKDATLKSMSEKINSYDDLGDFLTIKNQLGQLSTISENKNVLSRTFGILSAMLPTGSDSITISELNIDLSGEAPMLTFEAQANAGAEPYIDYNVLDAFKKSMPYLTYDYGRYVDGEGIEIPTYCMIENGDDGAVFIDEYHGMYAYWTIDRDGCNPAAANLPEGTESVKYSREDYKGESTVRIWRTPQFEDWLNDKYMSFDGAISGVPHFASSCVSYVGQQGEDGKVKWTTMNDVCKLVPDGTDGIAISESSNGRDSSGELVLRFASTIVLDKSVYQFTNKHMMAIAPSGRHNVTDSYVQVQKMFSERAQDCKEGDTACSASNKGER